MTKTIIAGMTLDGTNGGRIWGESEIEFISCDINALDTKNLPDAYFSACTIRNPPHGIDLTTRRYRDCFITTAPDHAGWLVGDTTGRSERPPSPLERAMMAGLTVDDLRGIAEKLKSDE